MVPVKSASVTVIETLRESKMLQMTNYDRDRSPINTDCLRSIVDKGLDNMSGMEAEFEGTHWLVDHVARLLDLIERLEYCHRRFDIVGHQWSRVRHGVEDFDPVLPPAGTVFNQLDAFRELLDTLDRLKPTFDKVDELALVYSYRARLISEEVATAGNALSRLGTRQPRR
jgi:hypothetical protein